MDLEPKSFDGPSNSNASEAGSSIDSQTETFGPALNETFKSDIVIDDYLVSSIREYERLNVKTETIIYDQRFKDWLASYTIQFEKVDEKYALYDRCIKKLMQHIDDDSEYIKKKYSTQLRSSFLGHAVDTLGTCCTAVLEIFRPGSSDMLIFCVCSSYVGDLIACICEALIKSRITNLVKEAEEANSLHFTYVEYMLSLRTVLRPVATFLPVLPDIHVIRRVKQLPIKEEYKLFVALVYSNCTKYDNLKTDQDFLYRTLAFCKSDVGKVWWKM